MVALCLIVALAGGKLASVLGIPLPYVLGSVGATLLVALLGWPIAPPGRWLVLPMRVVLGVLIGSSVSPELIANAKAILGAALCVPFYVVISSALSMFFYYRVARFSRDESFFAGLPGGLYTMTALAEDAGVGIRRVTICHTLRVTLVLMLIPLGIEQFLGSEIIQVNIAAPGTWTGLPLREVGLLIASGVIGAVLGRVTGLPGGLIVGPMVVSGLLHVTEISTARPPSELTIVAQVVLGASIGAQFVGERLASIRAVVGYTLGHVAIMLLLTVGFAAALAWLLDIPPVTSVISFAPGGLTEMTLVALGLNIDVGFVATLHFTRVVMILMLAPLIHRLFLRVSSGDAR